MEATRPTPQQTLTTTAEAAPQVEEGFRQGQLMHVFRLEDGSIELIDPDPESCIICHAGIEMERLHYPVCQHDCHLHCIAKTVFLAMRQHGALKGTCPACHLRETVGQKFIRFPEFVKEAGKILAQIPPMPKDKEIALFQDLGLWDTPAMQQILERDQDGEFQDLVLINVRAAVATSAKSRGFIGNWGWRPSREPSAEEVSRLVTLKAKLRPADYPKASAPLKRVFEVTNLQWLCKTFNVRTLAQLCEDIGFQANLLKYDNVPQCISTLFEADGQELFRLTRASIADMYELDSKELNLLGLDVRALLLMGLRKDHIIHFKHINMDNWIEDLGFDVTIMHHLGLPPAEVIPAILGRSWGAKALVTKLNITKQVAANYGW